MMADMGEDELLLMVNAMGQAIVLVAAEVNDSKLKYPHCDGFRFEIDPAGTINSHLIPWLLLQDPLNMYDCKVEIQEAHAERMLHVDEPNVVPLHELDALSVKTPTYTF